MQRAAGVLEERKFVDVADRQAVTPVEVGRTARCVDVALIVIGSVEGCIAGGSGVDVLRKGVGSLEVAASPAARSRGLQCVVDRIGIIGEDLIAAVAIQAGSGCARDGVGEGVGGDLETVPIYILNYDRVRGAGAPRLDRVTSFSQMDSTGTHIAHFQNPALAEFALDGEVPLLRVGHNEMPRDFEDEKVLGGVGSGSGTAAVGSGSVGVGKVGQLRQAWYPCA